MTTVLLMRHGETAWNANKRLQGWAPVGLSDRGREQAATVASYLDGNGSLTPDRVVASDLQRTRETTELVLSVIDVPVQFEAVWRERDLGVYQGLPYTTVKDQFPAFGPASATAADQTPESGESLVHVADRVTTGWDDLLAASDPEECVLVVTHGGPIRLLLGHLRDVSIEKALVDESPRNCSLTEIGIADGTNPTIGQRVVPWDES